MSDKPFTVSDRRHFTAEGQLRDEPEAGAAPASPKAKAPSPEATTPGEGPGEARRGPGGPPPKADLSSLVLSLAAQASLLLEGGEGLPEGMPASEGLAGAQSIISILEMLQDKTEGRRTEGETEVLEGVLYQLRMAYVARARVSGA